MRELFKNRPVLAWAAYDWANSAFATTVMAGFFPLFFKDFWTGDSDPTVSSKLLGIANGIAGVLVALLAPVLGAIADRGQRRKRFLMAWTFVGVVATAALCWVGQGEWAMACALYVIGTMGFNGAIVFYDALLMDIAKPHEYDRVSSFGFSAGYLGGGLLFVINVLMFLKPAMFGLASPASAVQMSFLTVAVWWLLFSLPLWLWVPEAQSTSKIGFMTAAKLGFSELRNTAMHIARYKQLLLFLVAYWLYIDGVNTIIKMAVDLGINRGLNRQSLIVALLLTQFVAFPAAMAFGYLGERIGAKRGILIGLVVYAFVTIYAAYLHTEAEFYSLAVLIGLVQGGVQSLSRSLFGRLVPEGKSAEFFGFFNMMGRFAAIIGPPLVGVITNMGGGQNAFAYVLLPMFIFGGVLLIKVRVGEQ